MYVLNKILLMFVVGHYQSIYAQLRQTLAEELRHRVVVETGGQDSKGSANQSLNHYRNY